MNISFESDIRKNLYFLELIFYIYTLYVCMYRYNNDLTYKGIFLSVI